MLSLSIDSKNPTICQVCVFFRQCCQLPGPNTCSSQTSLATPILDLSLPDQPDGNANSLQLLNVDCGPDALLQHFQLYSVSGTTVEYYHYTCCNVSTPLYCKVRTQRLCEQGFNFLECSHAHTLVISEASSST